MNPENEPPIVAISPLQQQRKPNMAPKNESPIVAFSPLQQHRDEEEYVPEQPTLFVAMGSPTLLIEQSEAHDFLREMGRRFHLCDPHSIPLDLLLARSLFSPVALCTGRN
eukprot:3740857-Rhodomonas_salina.2